MPRDQHIGELLEDVIDLIPILVSRHLLKRRAILRHSPHVSVVSKVGSLRVNREAVSDQPMGVRDAELAAPVGLWYLVHDDVPILPPVEIGQQHQRRVGDEQDFAILRCVLAVIDDVSDHPVTRLAMDRAEANIGC